MQTLDLLAKRIDVLSTDSRQLETLRSGTDAAWQSVMGDGLDDFKAPVLKYIVQTKELKKICTDTKTLLTVTDYNDGKKIVTVPLHPLAGCEKAFELLFAPRNLEFSCTSRYSVNDVCRLVIGHSSELDYKVEGVELWVRTTTEQQALYGDILEALQLVKDTPGAVLEVSFVVMPATVVVRVPGRDEEKLKDVGLLTRLSDLKNQVRTKFGIPADAPIKIKVCGKTWNDEKLYVYPLLMQLGWPKVYARMV